MYRKHEYNDHSTVADFRSVWGIHIGIMGKSHAALRIDENGQPFECDGTKLTALNEVYDVTKRRGEKSIEHGLWVDPTGLNKFLIPVSETPYYLYLLASEAQGEGRTA